MVLDFSVAFDAIINKTYPHIRNFGINDSTLIVIRSSVTRKDINPKCLNKMMSHLVLMAFTVPPGSLLGDKKHNM